MADGSPDDDAVVTENAALIVGRLAAKLDEVTRSIQQLLVTKIAELGGDPQLTQLLRLRDSPPHSGHAGRAADGSA
jgi:hypothetical protein